MSRPAGLPESGLADAAQGCFRGLLRAMSYPGEIVRLPAAGFATPQAMRAGTALIALSLLDQDTTVWFDTKLDTDEVRTFLHLRCGTRVVGDVGAAAFVLVADAMTMPSLDAFSIGDPYFPDRSATLVLQLPSLTGGSAVRLRGPGIEDSRTIDPSGLPASFWAAWEQVQARFPLGIDAFLTDGSSVIGLPRTVRSG